MTKEYFTGRDSIVRKIWSNSDTVLFIFAGAAAEFALNKAVDWLYFTGRLPADPIGRLFSTVSYAHQIIFSEKDKAFAAMDKITAIHAGVEASRGSRIPDWAYRDVLFMLIYYSIAAYELLEKKLTPAQKEELYDVFYIMGTRMGLSDLPPTYIDWEKSREEHLKADLAKSNFTEDLFLQYKKHLGAFRYQMLKGTQAALVPVYVKQLLGFRQPLWLQPSLLAYRLTRRFWLGQALKSALLPAAYRAQIKALNIREDDR